MKELFRPWKNPINYTLILIIKLWNFNKVISGPFEGLKLNQRFPTKAMLLGVWEKEISYIWDSLEGFKYIIDIGAAEGYYAVGLARKYSNKKIYAFEMNPSTQKLLFNVISDNSVKNIEIHGKCENRDLQILSDKLKDSLMIIDCEGYEIVLLNDDSTPILKNTTIVVELHEMYAPGCTHELRKRFSSTHYVKEIKGRHRNVNDWPSKLKILKYLFPRSLLLHFMDEGRPYPMNWLYMQPRSD